MLQDTDAPDGRTRDDGGGSHVATDSSEDVAEVTIRNPSDAEAGIPDGADGAAAGSDAAHEGAATVVPEGEEAGADADGGSGSTEAGAKAGADDNSSSNNNNSSGNGDPESDLRSKLEMEQKRSSEYEQKLKLALADFENLARRTQSTIENGVAAKTGALMLDVLAIYDDFVRARDAYARDGADASGLDSILRAMDTMLKKHDVAPIDALGEIFDPAMHEAISTDVDPALDENTVIKEIRKGYMLKNTIIRPALVVISKKEKV